ncbi:Hypothetical protein I596_384 [Dokdonella koreensis DS-123]|uniref:Uncharacterized protein n=1 Tax=Dokdonella koreensis DS-123 TaxID=1300342 RepID=A0A167GCW4_9GAMM|nr:Hypothetical protein I596_384 [Dokdonella koreensis DS-123]
MAPLSAPAPVDTGGRGRVAVPQPYAQRAGSIGPGARDALQLARRITARCIGRTRP